MTGDPKHIAPQKKTPSSDHNVTPQSAILDSEDIFHNQQEVVIKHNNQFYRLKITRQNKLILHK